MLQMLISTKLNGNISLYLLSLAFVFFKNNVKGSNLKWGSWCCFFTYTVPGRPLKREDINEGSIITMFQAEQEPYSRFFFLKWPKKPCHEFASSQICHVLSLREDLNRIPHGICWEGFCRFWLETRVNFLLQTLIECWRIPWSQTCQWNYSYTSIKVYLKQVLQREILNADF